MSNDRERILNLLATGKISVSDAMQLLEALSPSSQSATFGTISPASSKTQAKFMYVKVTSAKSDNVDVRIPLGLMRAGIRLTSLIPPYVLDHIHKHMGEKGITFDMNNIKPENIEDLVNNLSEMEVNVNCANGDVVRVYCA